MRWLRPSAEKIFARAFVDIGRNSFWRRVDEHTAIVLVAAVFGAGTVGHLAVTSIPSLKALWGRGDKTKATALLEVFSQPMLARWLAWADENLREPKKTRLAEAAELLGLGESSEGRLVLGFIDQKNRRHRAEWAKLLLNLFDDFSEERLKHFLDLDTQYQYEMGERDKKSRGEEANLHFEEARLLWAEAVAALGGAFWLTGWPTDGFPFADVFDLWDHMPERVGEGSPTEERDPDEFFTLVTLMSLLDAGWQAAAGYYSARVKAMR
jgi:hypothetical protein